MENKEQSETIISFKLSQSLKEDSRSLFAIVVRNPWKAPDGNIFNFIRMEFKLFRGENISPICVSLTPTQFQWIMYQIEKNLISQEVPAEKEGRFLCFERPNNIMDSVIVSIIDKCAKFGVMIESQEQSNLKSYAKMIEFVMFYQSAKNEKLKELVGLVYSSIQAEEIDKYIQQKCDGCKGESIIHDEHDCLKEIDEEQLKDLFLKSLNDDEVKKNFDYMFEHYCKLLNINEVLAQEAKLMLFPIIINEPVQLFQSVKGSYGFKTQDWKSKVIRRLNIIKRELNELEQIQDCAEPKNKRSRTQVE
jgi:hypothetical protein